jgi:hypothetical protein
LPSPLAWASVARTMRKRGARTLSGSRFLAESRPAMDKLMHELVAKCLVSLGDIYCTRQAALPGRDIYIYIYIYIYICIYRNLEASCTKLPIIPAWDSAGTYFRKSLHAAPLLRKSECADRMSKRTNTLHARARCHCVTVSLTFSMGNDRGYCSSHNAGVLWINASNFFQS